MKPWMKHAALTACILAAAILPRALTAGSRSNGLWAGVFVIFFFYAMPVLNFVIGTLSGVDVRRMWLFPAMLPVLSSLCWEAVFWDFSLTHLDFAALVISVAVGYAAMAACCACRKRRIRRNA